MAPALEAHRKNVCQANTQGTARAVPYFSAFPLSLAKAECLKRVTDVAYEHRFAPGRVNEREAGNVARCQKAALNRRDGHEVALPIPLQPQTVTGVRPRRVRLGIIEIAGENQVEITIAIDIMGDNSPHR